MTYETQDLTRQMMQAAKAHQLAGYANSVSEATVEPVTPLQERAKQLANEFDQLEAVIVALWSKLHPFLYDGQPAMEGKVPCKDAPHSRMWHELDQAAARVCHNRIVLAQLLERIEV